MFKESIELDGTSYDPLERYCRKDIPERLDMGLKDLRLTEKEIKQNFGKVPSDKCYITLAPEYKPKNFFEYCEMPGRTVFSLDRPEGIENLQIENEIIAAKGSGFLGWLSKESPSFKRKRGNRKYPIIVKNHVQVNARKYWGGQMEDIANWQYFNALILNTLIKRHHIPQATIKPIECIHFNQLPVLDNGKLKVIPLREYCDRSFKPDDEKSYTGPYFRLPDIQEAKNFAEFIYAGNAVHLRVPHSFTDIEKYGMRIQLPTAGIMSEHGSERQKWEIIENFVKRLAPLIKVVHSYKGTFTADTGKKTKLYNYISFASSVESSNVSLGGVICDLDTLYFHEDMGEFKKMMKFDIKCILKTVNDFADLYEDITRKPTSKRSYQMPYEYGYSTHGFGKKATQLFSDIYGLSAKTVKTLDRYGW
jgi:hypothetical protein